VADQERINVRLQNIRSVEPILGAMRTISLGSWQAALGRQQRIHRYSERLIALLPAVLPHLARKRHRRRAAHPPAPIAVLAIGSERGLCGGFNSSLANAVQARLEQYQVEGIQVELMALGKRIERTLNRRGLPVAWAKPLPTTSLPGRELAAGLIDMWMARYEAYELDAVDLIYNTFRNSTLYESVVFRILPPTLNIGLEGASSWPPSYVDTDPVSLYTRIIQLWTTTEMYRILLDSATAEHSARYQLMEGAVQNSKRLIEELTLALQSMRQQAITAEMQELAAGAGLVGDQ
jgi:F-type H+-transporting ATPase subunit gamma